MRIHFLDETKDERVDRLIGYITPQKTLVQVIVGAHDTPQTVAHFERISSWLKENKGRIVFTTDNEEGAFPEFSQGWNRLSAPSFIQSNIDKFGVSVNEILPALILGIDTEALIKGFRSVDKFPALLMAAYQYLLNRKGKNINVIFSYSSFLRDFDSWVKHLFDSKICGFGQGPFIDNAVGTIDQHSILEGMLNGPNNIFTIFIKFAYDKDDTQIIKNDTFASRLVPEYVFGNTIKDISNKMQAGVSRALSNEGRVNMTVELPQLDAYSLGELFGLFENTAEFHRKILLQERNTSSAVVDSFNKTLGRIEELFKKRDLEGIVKAMPGRIGMSQFILKAMPVLVKDILKDDMQACCELSASIFKNRQSLTGARIIKRLSEVYVMMYESLWKSPHGLESYRDCISILGGLGDDSLMLLNEFYWKGWHQIAKLATGNLGLISIDAWHTIGQKTLFDLLNISIRVSQNMALFNIFMDDSGYLKELYVAPTFKVLIF